MGYKSIFTLVANPSGPIILDPRKEYLHSSFIHRHCQQLLLRPSSSLMLLISISVLSLLHSNAAAVTALSSSSVFTLHGPEFSCMSRTQLVMSSSGQHWTNFSPATLNWASKRLNGYQTHYQTALIHNSQHLLLHACFCAHAWATSTVQTHSSQLARRNLITVHGSCQLKTVFRNGPKGFRSFDLTRNARRPSAANYPSRSALPRQHFIIGISQLWNCNTG
jgi:hypothetical protein